MSNFETLFNKIKMAQLEKIFDELELSYYIYLPEQRALKFFQKNISKHYLVREMLTLVDTLDHYKIDYKIDANNNILLKK